MSASRMVFFVKMAGVWTLMEVSSVFAMLALNWLQMEKIVWVRTLLNNGAGISLVILEIVLHTTIKGH